MAEENVKAEFNSAQVGINSDQSLSQVKKGQLTYALNAAVENYDANSVNYQNEPGNISCLDFPEGYKYIGGHFVQEMKRHIFFLVNPETGDSEIGYMDNNDCVYVKYINDPCLGFNINYPIKKCVHKTTNCSVEIYFTDGFNLRRFLDLNTPPYKTEDIPNSCDIRILDEIDCNKLNIQPNFSIPILTVSDVINVGALTAGTVQFAIQYSDVAGDGYTSYYSVTNPVPIANKNILTSDFNYNVGKSVILNISNIDTTGYFQYFNVAVIKTVNGISSVELVGTYTIDNPTKQIIYSGQNQTQVKLTMTDIIEKFPYYEIAQDITSVQDVIVWDQLISIDRINYQKIASQVSLQWETWRIPATEDYSKEYNATNLRGYLRDEVYSFELVFLLSNGKQTDGFHIPGRLPTSSDLIEEVYTNPDYIETGETAPRWKIYNTATVTATDDDYIAHSSYKGRYQYGEFSYWESSETYPCNEELWGSLAGQSIRHHKFPDVKISPIFENPEIEVNSSENYIVTMQQNAVFPIGVRIDISEIKRLIVTSDLTQAQKDNIIGIKIVRGNRDVNKSIVAKGILRNVGKYTREGTDYYFANYPYNDLREDPFLLEKTNAYSAECQSYRLTATANDSYVYTDCFTKTQITEELTNGSVIEICSISTPTSLNGNITVDLLEFDTYNLSVSANAPASSPFAVFRYEDYITGNDKTVTVDKGNTITVQVTAETIPTCLLGGSYSSITQINNIKNTVCYPDNLSAFEETDSKYRTVFNSPETSFGQPFLGNILKLENVLFGAGKAHFVQVKKNALYKLLTKEAQMDALSASGDIASVGTFSTSAMFSAYQIYLQIYINGITRKNYGWSYNSINEYNYYSDIDNDEGIKQRRLDVSQYLYPGVQSVGETIPINNYQRESSVYMKTEEGIVPLPFPSKTTTLLNVFGESRIEDKSRYINSQINCATPENLFDISSVVYYGSLKNIFPNQWGQIYSYETIDTGFQRIFTSSDTTATIFGGDTFISRFAFKTKLPFFIDNRVNAPDDSDVFYDEIGNIAYPEYWHSARSILYDYKYGSRPNLTNIISIKAHNFDCPNNQEPKPFDTDVLKIANPNRTFYDGRMYMFAYGIPSFYCESSINTDLRQAFNNKEGDFWPHVSTGIPDDWIQESNVPIVQDNTYYYNVTYSKQNKENYFSHLPENWNNDQCFTNYPFRAIFSEPQQSYTDNRINSWLIYKPASFYDFPQNYGKLTSLDGIQNRQVLVRFENKSFLYNALYTTQTNTRGQVYLGQSLFSTQVPPLDFIETDLGYVGSQHKFLLKVPQGQISIDAKRGQVFLLVDNKIKDLSEFGSGLHRFFTDHLAFEILRYFPTVDIDNHFKDIGLHGVYDSKFDRIIITKLDYIPLINDIKYDEESKEFYVDEITNNTVFKRVINVYDEDYFCNKSWTLSYNLNTNAWISFHSYLPNFYIGENNFFYSGLNSGCDLEIIAVEIVPTTTTTTTTGPVYDCDLEGNAHYTDCTLEGFAFSSTTTTTTTTTTSTTTTTTTTTSTTTTTTTSTTTTTTTTAPPTTTTTTTTIAPPSDLFGESNTTSAACLALGGSPETFYWASGPFGPGVVLYTDSGLSNPLTGFIYVAWNGDSTVYNLNSSTGEVGSSTGVTC